ncbi:MAG TPA: hypothetical protein VHA82_07385 [Ramlibacter sp.]|uniref:hypothetical protein n=1 Tax=Ramlibacter sp. TaxID=1917967 RepID=UPI002CA1D643|nr:hypothetical protein [Ramlibacter sp.]HVZ43617.1 hypothetical protein [Ramlibacter sp.]
MRARVIVLVVAILLIAGFAAFNWDEFTRTAPLSFGFVVADASLGLIMLGIVAALLIVFLAASAMHRTQTLVESRHYYRELETQRDLAERAEASRFNDLRRYMDAQLRELHQRDAIAATEFEKALVSAQRDLRTYLENIHRMTIMRFDEFERRMDARFAAGAEPSLEARRRVEDALEPPPRVRHPL